MLHDYVNRLQASLFHAQQMFFILQYCGLGIACKYQLQLLCHTIASSIVAWHAHEAKSMLHTQ